MTYCHVSAQEARHAYEMGELDRQDAEREREKEEHVWRFENGYATDQEYTDLSEYVVCDPAYDAAWREFVGGNPEPLQKLTAKHVEDMTNAS